MSDPSPFTMMAQALAGRRYRRSVTPGDPSQPETLTDRIRAFIREAGPVTGAHVALELDVPGDTGRVYALLKADIQKGQIHFAGGKYQWSESYDRELAERLKAAAHLLRRHGFKVVRPGRAA